MKAKSAEGSSWWLFWMLVIAFMVVMATLAFAAPPGNFPVTSSVPTNAWTAVQGNCMVTDITVHNSSASDLWVHVYDSGTNALDGARPTLPPIKVTAGGYQSYFWTQGRTFKYGVTVMTSATGITLTNSTASFMIDVTVQ